MVEIEAEDWCSYIYPDYHLRFNFLLKQKRLNKSTIEIKPVTLFFPDFGF